MKYLVFIVALFGQFSLNAQLIKSIHIQNYQTYLSRAKYLSNGYITITNKTTPTKIVLTKYNFYGTIKWSKEFTLGNIARFFDITEGRSGNLYCLTGDNQSKVKVLKIDSLGNIIWVKKVETSSLNLIKSFGRIKNDLNENIYISPPVGDRAFIQKFDSSGNVIYSTLFSPDTTISYLSQDFIIMDDGGVMGVGYCGPPHIFRLDSLGNILWSKVLNNAPGEFQLCYSLIKTTMGKYLVAGILYSSSINQNRTILHEINADGDIFQTKVYHNPNNSNFVNAMNVFENPPNEIIFCGFGQNHNPAIMKIDSLFQFNCYYELPDFTNYVTLNDFKNEEILFNIEIGARIIRLQNNNPVGCNLITDCNFTTNNYLYDTTLINHNYTLLTPPATNSNSASLIDFLLITDSLYCDLIETPAFISEINSSIIVIHPNPVQSVLYFENDFNFESVFIFDSFGKLISYDRNISSIDVSGYSSGLYIMKCLSGNKIFTQKFIKE